MQRDPPFSKHLGVGKISQIVIFCNNPDENEILQAPSGNQQARSLDWVQSRITDLSTLNLGYITCGNSYKVAINNLRVMQ